MKKIQTALVSVYYKDGLDRLALLLHRNNVKIFSTGGTYDFLKSLDIPAEKVENLTSYPSILGGRVKTLHPKVFGGILGRSSNHSDKAEMDQYGIPAFDLVIVDLYPFEETVANTTDASTIIEKIDIGGISLIRAGAKNFQDVLIVPASKYYGEAEQLLESQDCSSSMDDRKRFASYAFAESSHYDSAIYNWFAGDEAAMRLSQRNQTVLRYGENPHQKGVFHGDTAAIFDQLHGKELSYNNLLDLDAGLNLINEFDKPAFAILKHNNACGIAVRDDIATAYEAALAGDPVSAFGGVLVANRAINVQTAKLMNSLFFEIVVAPDFEADALELLYSKKNRIVLRLKTNAFPKKTYRSILNGFLEQERDQMTEQPLDLKTVTQTAPTPEAIEDLVFANKIVKHTRSNAIVLVKNKQLIGSGIGQTSRVDALKQAIIKAKEFGFDLHGAVLASDAFFPFADSIALAHEAGIVAVVQPGGSVRDQESIDYCNANGLAMVFTGIRHFKH